MSTVTRNRLTIIDLIGTNFFKVLRVGVRSMLTNILPQMRIIRNSINYVRYIFQRKANKNKITSKTFKKLFIGLLFFQILKQLYMLIIYKKKIERVQSDTGLLAPNNFV